MPAPRWICSKRNLSLYIYILYIYIYIHIYIYIRAGGRTVHGAGVEGSEDAGAALDLLEEESEHDRACHLHTLKDLAVSAAVPRRARI